MMQNDVIRATGGWKAIEERDGVRVWESAIYEQKSHAIDAAIVREQRFEAISTEQLTEWVKVCHTRGWSYAQFDWGSYAVADLRDELKRRGA